VSYRKGPGGGGQGQSEIGAAIGGAGQVRFGVVPGACFALTGGAISACRAEEQQVGEGAEITVKAAADEQTVWYAR
jgi:hypothetical protein